MSRPFFTSILEQNLLHFDLTSQAKISGLKLASNLSGAALPMIIRIAGAAHGSQRAHDSLAAVGQYSGAPIGVQGIVSSAEGEARFPGREIS